MPKQLVTAIGLVVSLGVIALGVFLVALPLYLQAVDVDTQTANVASANATSQAEVDNLRVEEENIDAINASVDGLRAQIPATGQLDDVFEVVARAAGATGIALTAVTAGEQVVFVARTEATDADAPAPAPTPAPAATPTPGATDTATDPGTAPPVDPGTSDVAAAGQQQVDFVISASAVDMQQATAFLDALRAGPRLLSNVSAIATRTGEGTVDLQVSALTYIAPEG